MTVILGKMGSSEGRPARGPSTSPEHALEVYLGGVREGRPRARPPGRQVPPAPDPAAGTASPLEPPPLPRAYNVYSSLTYFVSFGKNKVAF